MLHWQSPLLLSALLVPLVLLLWAARYPVAMRQWTSLLFLWKDQAPSGVPRQWRWHRPPLALWLFASAWLCATLAAAGLETSSGAAQPLLVIADRSPSMNFPLGASTRYQAARQQVVEWSEREGVELVWQESPQPNFQAFDRYDCLWLSDALAEHPERAGLCLSGAKLQPGPLAREGRGRWVLDGNGIRFEPDVYPATSRQIEVRGQLPAAIDSLLSLWCEEQQLIRSERADAPLLEVVFPMSACALDPTQRLNGQAWSARVGLAAAFVQAVQEEPLLRVGDQAVLLVFRGSLRSSLCQLELDEGASAAFALEWAAAFERALREPEECVGLDERRASGAAVFRPPNLVGPRERRSWVGECALAAALLALAACGVALRRG